MEKLREHVEQLHEELARTEEIDPAAREALEEALRDVEEILGRSDATPETETSLRERLEEATRQFEESHPTLSAMVGRVANALANLGI